MLFPRATRHPPHLNVLAVFGCAETKIEMHHGRALSRGPGPLSVTNLHADTLGGLFPAIHSALNRKQISLCKTHRTISWPNINTELVMGGPPKKLRGDSQNPRGGFRKQPFPHKQQSLASGRTEREAPNKTTRLTPWLGAV